MTPQPYYSDDFATIYHGDCREVMCDLPAEVAEIVVTSPPYNMGLTPGGNGRGMYGHTTQKSARFTNDGYDGHSDALPPKEHDRLCRDALELSVRAASRGVFWNCRPRVVHGRLEVPFGLDFSWIEDMTEGRVTLRKVIAWDRGTGIDVNLNHYATCHEWILLLAWDQFRLVDHSASGFGDVWRLGMEHNSPHPAPFPLSLPSRAISTTGATTVLDPFMGSGTTLRAAKDLGRRCIGIEKSERYCEIAARRLAQEVLDFGAAS